MKAPQKTPGIDKAYFKNFWPKTIIFQTLGSLCKGEKCQVIKNLDTIPDCKNSSKLKQNIQKMPPIFYVYFVFPYKIPHEDMVHSMAKRVQNPQTFLIRAILQGLCACKKLKRQLYLVYQISVDTVGQLLEESIYYELEMRSSAGFFILLF